MVNAARPDVFEPAQTTVVAQLLTSASLPQKYARRDSNEGLYYTLSLIRRTEETLLDLFSQGKLAGTTHTSIGQEAIAVGLGAHLTERDVVLSTHRCHGHFLAYGGPLIEFFAELMGRDSELCGGRGGSQHLHFRNFYSNGIQGGTVGNAVGMALAEKMQQTDGVVVSLLGDGTLGEGLVYESFNFAALQQLPILWVLENNRYAQSTPVELGVSGSMRARAEAFGIAADEIETNDAIELQKLFRARLAHVREHQQPFLQVVHTYRLAPHSKGDDNRDPAEIERWRLRDPKRLLEEHVEPTAAQGLAARADAQVRAAVALADQRPHAMVAEGPVSGLRTAPQATTPFVSSDVTFVQALNKGLHDIFEQDTRACLLGEDVTDPYGGAFKVTQGLSSRFPQRVFGTPISEAGLVAWATGAAMRGMHPIVEIMFGDFVTLATDQIVNHAAKYRGIYGGAVDVPLVVRLPMGGRRGYGPTHSQSLETLFTSVPGLAMVAPSHLLDPGQLLVRAVADTLDPVLFIENKLLYAKRLALHQDGRIGEFFVTSDHALFPTLRLSLIGQDHDAGPDMVLTTYGGNVPLAMEVAECLLVDHEIICDLVVPSLISPLPVESMLRFVGGVPKVAVLEEGNKRGGWGAEVIASLVERATNAPRAYMRFGGPDSPLPASKVLEDQLLPSVDSIVRALARW